MHSRSYVTVRYAETDKMGIAHHADYPVWFEIGRTDFIRLFDISYTQLEEAGVMIPLRNLNCHYILPAKYEDRLIVRTWCTNITAARIEFSYTIKRREPDGTETELCYGSTEHGFVDGKTFRPCSIKKRMPNLYEVLNKNVKEI
ncbi:MAG: thioesterase family protein [Ruminococcus sp.]|nr:thioesterase family protein [Ruminococcus sp.]